MTQLEVKKALLSAGVENAAIEAPLLCEKLDGDALEDAVRRRCDGYPLQYLLGEWCFYRENYEVSEDCLIPRSDTEILVEQAVRLLPPNARFLDLCTGSGCVAISTLCARPDAEAVAVDLFENTLALAERNAIRNGVVSRMTTLQADVLCDPPLALSEQRFDAILSNPPYIRTEVMAELQREVQFEPAAALCGGEDGLDFYRDIIKRWGPLLQAEGFFLFEIGYDQASDLCEIGEKYGFSHTVWRDYGGNDRVVRLQK